MSNDDDTGGTLTDAADGPNRVRELMVLPYRFAPDRFLAELDADHVRTGMKESLATFIRESADNSFNALIRYMRENNIVFATEEPEAR